jgi:hypothetical protein
MIFQFIKRPKTGEKSILAWPIFSLPMCLFVANLTVTHMKLGQPWGVMLNLFHSTLSLFDPMSHLFYSTTGHK